MTTSRAGVLPSILALASALTLPSQTTIIISPGKTIQSGIDQAKNGDTVLVLPGTYKENIDFKGKDIVVRSFEISYNTTIDGGAAGTVVTFRNGESRKAVLQGFTIQGGLATYGGGIHIDGASPTIRGCRIRLNRAVRKGGGMGGNPLLPTKPTSPLVEDCVLEQNADGGTPNDGGGAVGFEGSVSNAVVSRPEFRRCLFRDNTGGGRGGACSFSYKQDAVFDSCIFTRNVDLATTVASINGGGAMNFANLCTGTVTNCRFYENHGVSGSCIKAYQATVNCNNNTFVNNVGGAPLGAAVSPRGRPMAPGIVNATNCILWNNGKSEASTNPVRWATVNLAFCDLTVGTFLDTGVKVGAGMISADPKLANARAWTHHLLPGSPCIDKGDNSAVVQIPRDMNDRPRISGRVVDIGADEYDIGNTLLYTDRGQVSIANPGKATFTLTTPSGHAGLPYAIVPGLSGTWPGLTFGGLHFPMNFDAFSNLYMRGMVSAAGTGGFALDMSGIKGDPNAIGLEVFWAAAVMTSHSFAAFSNNLSLEFVK